MPVLVRDGRRLDRYESRSALSSPKSAISPQICGGGDRGGGSAAAARGRGSAVARGRRSAVTTLGGSGWRVVGLGGDDACWQR
ncbi:Os03g0346500 [Oryza sativa Japonica Group]|uniref:Expressed protein n=3 Tax=Oryza sativa TaxID=4530 RepID=Q10LJ5_ORYSJ|nr:expressed protein [Oryza sativa Japonica Group]EEC75243.1 hypothetical protein OsI_11544 [Oryza sativa Indica Group]KAB8091766.1 hypothetical protein EE612_017368 [Oryza sativa]EEE59048.1 hypothetical protein OsJ_10818 [Oryza sativa Japonica Group]BAF12006.1 Os03g0346500 [Oryza sativa Japonica Group]|eukprot:NP_001050092.1 Os03g0346500 [Oryza sativa Japonica Group]